MMPTHLHPNLKKEKKKHTLLGLSFFIFYFQICEIGVLVIMPKRARSEGGAKIFRIPPIIWQLVGN
jgi:hypothetical protein